MKKKMTKALALVLCMIMVFTVAGPLCVNASEVTTEAKSTVTDTGDTGEAGTKSEEATTIYKPETTITTDTKTDVDEAGNTSTTTTTVESGKDDKASYDSTTVETKTENADGSSEIIGNEKGEQHEYGKDEFYQGDISTTDKTLKEWEDDCIDSEDGLIDFYPDGITESTTTETTGDIKEDENDKEYDQTTTDTDNRKLTIGVFGEEEVDKSETDITSIKPDFSNASELEISNSKYQPSHNIGDIKDYVYDDEGKSHICWNNPEGYDYYYSGHSAEPEDNKYTVIYTDTKGNTKKVNVTQFVLTENDKPTNKNVAYCCDFNTTAEGGHWYTIDNLEDADYYNSTDADKIKYLAMNGYWGTSGDEDSIGSLTHFKELLKQNIAYISSTNSHLTDKEKNALEALKSSVDSITDAQAMVITQAAIWAYGKRSNEYTFKGFEDDTVLDVNTILGIANESPNNISLMKGLLDVFIASEHYTVGPTIPELSTDETKVIDVNSINKVGVTVKEKNVEETEKYGTNIYNCDIGLILDVNITEDDKIEIYVRSYFNGNVTTSKVNRYDLLPKGSTATNAWEIVPDSNGKYTLPVSLSKDVKVDLDIKGTQKLNNGVYIYTAKGGTNKSQTFVSIGEGTRKVDVSKSMKIYFTVKEASKTTDREWSREWAEAVPAPVQPPVEEPKEEPKEDPKPEPPKEETPTEEPKEDIPVEVPVKDPEPEVEEPEVPTPEKVTEVKKEVVKSNTAKAPKTGDESHIMFYIIIALSAILSGTIIVCVDYVSDKRKDRK